MNKEEAKANAEHYRSMYRMGLCTRDEAKENIQPFLDMVNEKSLELCKKYNQKHKKVTFIGYIR